jgi:hypothetical protein
VFVSERRCVGGAACYRADGWMPRVRRRVNHQMGQPDFELQAFSANAQMAIHI